MSDAQQSNDGVRFRAWLEKRRVYFDTIAATLLSAMAVIVSVAQISISREQNTLARKQTEIALLQLAREERTSQIRATSEWGRLRNAMWEILDSIPSGGEPTLKGLSHEEGKLWFEKVRKVLDSQIDNEALISDQESLGYWRNAISTAKTGGDIAAQTGSTEIVSGSALSIMKDVLHVWERLVLNSSQVSPTGGHPAKN